MTRGANQSRYVSAMINSQAPLTTNQNDQIALRSTILRDRKHVARLLIKGKMYGPMTVAQQIEAVRYAYDAPADMPTDAPRPRTGLRTVIWGDVN